MSYPAFYTVSNKMKNRILFFLLIKIISNETGSNRRGIYAA